MPPQDEERDERKYEISNGNTSAEQYSIVGGNTVLYKPKAKS
jgi:hypothetical protein